MSLVNSQLSFAPGSYLDSGLSVRDFCINQNFAVSTFYSWKKKLEQKESTPAFIPLHVGNQAMVSTNKYTEVTLQNDKPKYEENELDFTFPNGTKLHIKGQVDLAFLKTIVHLY